MLTLRLGINASMQHIRLYPCKVLYLIICCRRATFNLNFFSQSLHAKSLDLCVDFLWFCRENRFEKLFEHTSHIKASPLGSGCNIATCLWRASLWAIHKWRQLNVRDCGPPPGQYQIYATSPPLVRIWLTPSLPLSCHLCTAPYGNRRVHLESITLLGSESRIRTIRYSQVSHTCVAGPCPLWCSVKFVRTFVSYEQPSWLQTHFLGPDLSAWTPSLCIFTAWFEVSKTPQISHLYLCTQRNLS